MIYYVAKRREFNTLAVQLICLFPELQKHMRLVPYERLYLLDGIEEGVLIWSDLDRMSTDETRSACALAERLTSPGTRVAQLNSPTLSLRRFDLLRRLLAEGINSYDVYRLDEQPRCYPVFLRSESGFARTAPPLLADSHELQTALDDFAATGIDPRDQMIVEFASRPWSDGYYRKYGAYRIGDHVFPQHCIIAPQWFIKTTSCVPSPGHRRERLLYFHENPHREALKKVFELAGIQYGRIDYTVIDGAIQVFEINTNPTVISNPPTRGQPDERPYAQAHACALLALPSATEDDATLAGADVVAEASARIVRELRWKLKTRLLRRHINKIRRSVRSLAEP